MHKITEILSQKISDNAQKIEAFFAKKFQENPQLFYNSVDLRHSQVKIAPIDTNCFPAGFNNLSESSKEKAKIIADEFFLANFPNAKKILILPESHTRNLRYLENVRYLQEIIAAKREVVVGTLLAEKVTIDLENGHFMTLHPLQKKDGKIEALDGFTADVIVLNNDLTDGIPEIFKEVSTPIVPSEKMGWHSRTKSRHFDIYNQLAVEVADILAIDPWLISSMHSSHKDVNFKEQKGLENLAQNVDLMIENLRKKYQEYGIEEDPYCYIKADNGTYGIAVWAVFSGQDVLEINKKERNKMSMLKGSVQNTQVMLQEGIKTVDKIDAKIAEPMIYLINGQVVANLFRANETRDEKISLNSTGASFFDLENLSENQLELGLEKNKITAIYSLIARLAALAAAIENQHIS
ncbi:MAG: glutamate--cysteine ligase [Rickettsiales bacterium]|nr:glutamate--cysteine ligase [Rickettsiales bacterium]